ncbi:MAG TPA: DUF3052 domain-containing protein [Acidimicrobiales bacterium]|nr:DUF3052 domain-containing protein [Acidimicrobiales bacterium]
MPTGHAATPLARKLGLGPGHRLSLDHAPSGWAVPDAPDGVVLVDAPEHADVLVSFFGAAGELPGRLAVLGARIFPAGSLWIAWPRRAGGHSSDMTDAIVRGHVLAMGLVDTKIAALDEDWSALRVVWRREHRGGGAPPTVARGG